MYICWFRRFLLASVVLIGLFAFAGLQEPRAQAATPTLTIVQPSVNGKAIGHVGTKISLQGTNFSPNRTVNLFTTTNGDPAQCVNGNGNLNVFTTNPNVTAKGDGSFTVGVNTMVTWPDNAGNAGQAYYVCAITQNRKITALSTTNFTVANPVSINISPSTTQAGGQLIVTGSNWFPPQPITVNVYNGNNEAAPLTSDTGHSSNADGTLNITLTLPASAQAGTYNVHVFAQAQNEVNMTSAQNNILTVTQVTPTPTLPPSPTATATSPPTATPTSVSTPVPGNNGGTGPGMANVVLLAVGGFGLLLVVVGIVLFVMYSRKQ